MKRLIVLLLIVFTLLHTKEHFVIYVNAHLNHNTTLARWQPTIDYLNQKLPKYHFSLLPIKPTQIDEIKKLLDEKKIDFLITQPAIYTELEYTHNINALLTMSNKYNMSQFGSVIITHKDSGIKTIKDIRGKRVGAIAPFGFGGWLIGYDELLNHGIDPLSTKNVEFVGSQKKVLQEVLAKKLDVGIVRTGMLEKLSQSINTDTIYVINQQKSINKLKLSTKLYPEWAFAVASHIDLTLSNQLFDALIALNSDSKAAKAGGYHDWHLAQNYNQVDKMFQRLRIGHYQDMPQYTLHDIVHIVVVSTLLFIIFIIYSRYKMINSIKKKLQEEIEIKTHYLEKANIELNTIFDLNPHITIITNGKQIQRVNHQFLDFLGIKHLNEFTKEYDCICDRFEEQEGYLKAKIGEQTWIEYVSDHPNLFHKALIIQNNQELTLRTPQHQ